MRQPAVGPMVCGVMVPTAGAESPLPLSPVVSGLFRWLRYLVALRQDMQLVVGASPFGR